MNDLSDPKRAIMREPDSPRGLAFDTLEGRELPAVTFSSFSPTLVLNADTNGFNNVVDRKDFTAPKFVGSWGVSDEDLFDMADARIRTLTPAHTSRAEQGKAI